MLCICLAWVKVKGSKLKLGDWDLGLTLGKGEYAWCPFLCNTWRSLNFRAALFTVAPVLLDEQAGYIWMALSHMRNVECTQDDDLCDGDPLGVAEWSACRPLYATKRLLVVVQEWEMTSFAWKYFRRSRIIRFSTIFSTFGWWILGGELIWTIFEGLWPNRWSNRWSSWFALLWNFLCF